MNQKIRIGLFGFGRTGRFVANEFALDARFELAWVVRKTNRERHQPSSQLLGLHEQFGTIFPAEEVDAQFFELYPVDIIVDFSHPDSLAEYAPAVDRGTKIIAAISHYDESHLLTLRGWSERTSVLCSPNITLGVNCLLVASQVLQQIAPHADIEVIEEHFRGKDSPSGTALKLAYSLGLDPSQKINSIRVGGVVGRHEVVFGLPNQTIRLTHESISRAAFGQGAIFAARWLSDQGPGFYTMERIISEMFRNHVPVY